MLALNVILYLLPIEEFLIWVASKNLLRLDELGLLGLGNKGHSSTKRRFDLGPYVYDGIVKFRSDYMPLKLDFDEFPDLVYPSRKECLSV